MQADNGVGDCESSWGADGACHVLWHGGSQAPWDVEWRDGDVVGVAADVTEGSLLFARNGEWAKTFEIEPGTALFLALSKGHAECARAIREHIEAAARLLRQRLLDKTSFGRAHSTVSLSCDLI